jgi:hypothetical protein
MLVGEGRGRLGTLGSPDCGCESCSRRTLTRAPETPVATTAPHSLYERSDPDEGVTHLSAAYGLALGLDAMVGQLVPLVRLHLP